MAPAGPVIARPPAGATVVPLGCAAEIDAAAWDRLARRGHHRHRWFVAAEAGGLRPLHVGVRDATGWRAVIPAYLESAALHGDLHDRWLGSAREALDALGVRLRPTVTVAPPFGTTSEPLGDWFELPDTILDEVFDLLEERARDEGAKAVVWPYIDPAGERARRIARRRGYAESFAGSAARLDIAWTDFSGYIASRTKSVRRTIRAELRALRESGAEPAILEDFREVAGELDALYREAFRRRNGHAPRLAPEFFKRLAATPGPDTWVQLLRHRGRLVGVSLNVEASGRVDGGFAAFAPGWEGGAAYMHDLVYEPVRFACAAGHRVIELGPTALYPKVLRGAVLYPRTTVVLGLTSANRALFTGLGRAIGWHNRRKERRRLGALADRALAPGGVAAAGEGATSPAGLRPNHHR